MWGVMDGENKIAWVRWDTMCRPKEEGGLGVKDWGMFNKALLGKWRWRMLRDHESMCCRVLWAKYKNQVPQNTSAWWKDLHASCFDASSGGWFEEGIQRRIGEGNDTQFWNEKWLGVDCLRDLFGRLFILSMQQNNKIKDMGKWYRGVWRWDFRWRRV